MLEMLDDDDVDEGVLTLEPEVIVLEVDLAVVVMRTEGTVNPPVAVVALFAGDTVVEEPGTFIVLDMDDGVVFGGPPLVRKADEGQPAPGLCKVLVLVESVLTTCAPGGKPDMLPPGPVADGDTVLVISTGQDVISPLPIATE